MREFTFGRNLRSSNRNYWTEGKSYLAAKTQRKKCLGVNESGFLWGRFIL
jgi:hypothetical protein